jgi:glycine C-acetyltransferase/8-amino-7-oxononanoate synthase
MLDHLEDRLAELREAGLERRTRVITGPQGPHVLLDGRPVVLLCSNNYLGLADHPTVRHAAAEAALKWGAGAGASRLVSGTMTVHEELEARLADFKRTEAAVLFGSGYLANLGVIGALAGDREALVLSDELNHASIVDGCRLARAQTVVYRHGDVEHAQHLLHRARGRRVVIVTDSVFSMDGDVAPLWELAELAGAYGAALVVDEAHATGCIGEEGRGAVAEAGLEGEVDVVIGTLGKALGSYGAFAACSATTARFLFNAARSLIFSTAPAPPALAAADAALDVLEAEPQRVRRLQANAAVLRAELAIAGFETPRSTTQIVPLMVGDAAKAVALSDAALELGVFAQAIRPPTVPDGTSRLRLAVMATHEPAELRRAARRLAQAAGRVRPVALAA